MGRSDTMARLLRLARLAERCERTGESADEALGQARDCSESRRKFSKGVVAATGTAAAWSVSPLAFDAIAKAPRDGFDYVRGGQVAVIGAGLAGLSCASELARLKFRPSVFEASDRVGGRCASLRDVFPGQVVERGGEYISSSHHTMLGYARRFGLRLEISASLPGATYYALGGSRYTEAQVASEYGEFTASIREDLATLQRPTADQFTEHDAVLDYMSLDDYLSLHKAGPLLRGVIGGAYLAEFGATLDELSAISFLRFVYGDRRTKQMPVGRNAGEFLRVVDGNDQITTRLAQQLPTPVSFGHRLVSVRKLAGGKLRLGFDVGGSTVHGEYDAVVLTLPFTVLRDVELHPSLELPDWKRQAIASADLGRQGKLMVGFGERVWQTRHGSNGSGYSDRAFAQSTWEASPGRSDATRGVLAAHIGGQAGRALSPATLATDTASFLSGLEAVMPGATAAASRNGQGAVLAYAENWAANPFSKGTHTFNRPGYFTTTADNEAKAVDNLLFAGEHTSSFYEWQGFMEGAALSGLRAAGEVMALARI
ncbi:flavin monoamine oxidase family protein [Arenimonas sp. MALMAid1274]|uniref:flavin monoamine oxidase family protein n=1 Tax=Arenimonas sp. MALMAid1274 TaxID=3411630 RepID=UPI003BA161BF